MKMLHDCRVARQVISDEEFDSGMHFFFDRGKVKIGPKRPNIKTLLWMVVMGIVRGTFILCLMQPFLMISEKNRKDISIY